jgi:hypothetical protein
MHQALLLTCTIVLGDGGANLAVCLLQVAILRRERALDIALHTLRKEGVETRWC